VSIMKVVLGRPFYVGIDQLDEEIIRYIVLPQSLSGTIFNADGRCSGGDFCWRHIEGMSGAAYMSRVAQSIQPKGVSMPGTYLIEHP